MQSFSALSTWAEQVQRSPARRRGFAAAIALGLLLLRWRSAMFGWSFQDLAVYRRAGAAIVDGASPYAIPGTLPFTYPPFAAVVFVPFQLVGAGAAAAMLSLLSVVSLITVLVVCGRQLGLTRDQLIVAGLLCLCLEPVLRTFRLGQVNLELAALVLLDCFVVPRRFRGVLTGVAAGLKLTPAIFVGWFLLRHDWRAVAGTVAGGLLTVLVSAMAAPGPTWLFWTRLWYDPGHVGGVAYVDNQSLFGVVVRLLRTEHPAGLLIFVVDVLALALGAAAALRQHRDGQLVAAAVAVGITGLLISPISWSHHWVWMVPAMLVLAVHGRWLTLWSGAGVAYLAVQWSTPAGGLREFHDDLFQQLLCASFPLWGVAYLAVMATKSAGTSTRSRRRLREHAAAQLGTA